MPLHWKLCRGLFKTFFTEYVDNIVNICYHENEKEVI